MKKYRLFLFETMVNAAARKVPPKEQDIPEITGYPSLAKEIRFLQKELARFGKQYVLATFIKRERTM